MTPDQEQTLENIRKGAKDALEETRATVLEALGYIDACEDTRFTMTVCLREIRDKVDELERRMDMMDFEVTWLVSVIRTMNTQRDLALRQLDLVKQILRGKPRR